MFMFKGTGDNLAHVTVWLARGEAMRVIPGVTSVFVDRERFTITTLTSGTIVLPQINVVMLQIQE